MTQLSLPTGWSMTSLAEIASTSAGGTPNSKTPGFYDGDIPWLKIGDLPDGPVQAASRNITEEGLRASSAKWLPAGTLLVAMYGSIGKLGILTFPATTNQAICAIQPSKDVSVDYLFWALHYQRHALDQLGRGGAQRNISQTDLKAWTIPLAPRDLQNRIVLAINSKFARLDAIEAELDETDRLASQFRQALLRDAFSGRLTHGDELPDSDELDENDREILPEGWAWKNLDDLAEVRSGITKNSKLQAGTEVPYLSTANVQAGRLDLGTVKVILASDVQREKHRLEVGDVLVLEGGDPDKVGRGWVWEGQIDGCLHQNHVFSVRPDRSLLVPEFLAYYVNAPQARAAFLARAKQTTGIASINKTQLRSLPIPVPSLGSQRQVIERIRASLNSIHIIEEEAAALRQKVGEARASVLHQAFSGRLGVSSTQDRDVPALSEPISIPA